MENVKKSCEKRTKYLQDVVTAAAEPPVKESGGDIDWDEVLEWWMGVSGYNESKASRAEKPPDKCTR